MSKGRDDKRLVRIFNSIFVKNTKNDVNREMCLNEATKYPKSRYLDTYLCLL